MICHAVVPEISWSLLWIRCQKAEPEPSAISMGKPGIRFGLATRFQDAQTHGVAPAKNRSRATKTLRAKRGIITRL